MFGQLLIEGLAIGACYGLLGIAVAVIYKTSGVINFAQGEMGMLTTFVVYHFLTIYHFPFWAAFIAALIFAVTLGALIQVLFLRQAEDPTELGLLIITLGAELALMAIAGWKWGGDQKAIEFPLSIQSAYEPVKGFFINEWTIGVLVLVPLIMLALFLFFKYSKTGKAMRATQQNKDAAKLMGINVERIFALVWVISSVIGAIAAMFFAARSVVEPSFMMESFIRAFAGAVLGGLFSIPGVVLGGLMLGLIENFFGFYWPEWKPIVAFAVIVVILTIRPSGLFARHYVKKV
jgi:branched-chain amino acid transport system permease protein